MINTKTNTKDIRYKKYDLKSYLLSPISYLFFYFCFALILSFTSYFLSPLSVSAATLGKAPNNLGLVGYWSMNEGGGSTIEDSSGFRNTGTITGATWSTGKLGRGLSFDGNDYINAGTNDNLNMTGDFSVSLWFKTSGQTLNTWGSLIGRGTAAYFIGPPNKGWYLVSRNLSGTNYINFQYSGASANQQVSWMGGSDNLWHHVIVSRQGNLFSIYIDGVYKSSLTTAVGDMSASGENFYIGKGRSNDYFIGSLDEVRIYNRALSATEVANLYKAGSAKMANSNNEVLPSNAVIGLVRENCTGYTYCATSLSAWQTMMLGGSGPINWTGCTVGDLVCKNVTAVAKIDGSWSGADATPITITGWTTGANNYIKIYTAPQARHSGKWDTSKYRLYVSDATSMNILEDYVNITGLQIGGYGYTAHDESSISINGQNSGANQINISESILYRTHTNGIIGQGVYMSDWRSVVNIWNSMIIGSGIYNWSNRNACVYVSNGTLNIYNSTLVTSYGNGLSRDGGIVTAKNVYASASVNSNYYNIATLINSASADSTGSPGFQNIAYSTANFVNVTPGSENLHLTSNSALRNLGASTSGDASPLNYSTDIDKEKRIDKYDVGADEYPNVTYVSSSQNNKLTNGLVGMWSFNGADMNWGTGKAYDRSGQGNNGNIANMSTTTSPVSGKLGQALGFNGSSSYVNTSLITNDVATGSVTVSVWVKLAVNHTSVSVVKTFFSLQDSPSSNDIVLCFSGSGSSVCNGTGSTAGSICLMAYNTIHNFACTSTTSWSANIWYHVVGQIDTSGGGMKVYVNGVQNGSNANTTRGAVQSTHSYIGGEINGSSAIVYKFPGVIDEFRVYNRALSSDEVKQLYNMGK